MEEEQQTGNQEVQTKQAKKKSLFRDILDGSILTRDVFVTHLPFLFFIAFLGMVYIANRYHAEKVVRDIAKLQKEVKDIRTESIEIQRILLSTCNQSNVARLVNDRKLGLIQPDVPPKKIKIKN
ncbi:MAG: FtsL-like putative cell division protein [Bacteroidia bacterium]|nr:FtsL-like putative cell division protein [Bacteroidia bacterium]